jgi:ribonuclease G
VFNLKEIYIERKENFIRAAVLENGRLKECVIEEENLAPQPGQIYKGIVKNIVPAIKCAFIDIGYDKNCYMYIDRKFNNTKIKKNQELMVEILKESVGEKGPKVTNAITIPGRYAVLETINKDISISKKIKDESLKASLREKIVKPEEVGITIRTNAAKLSVDLINKEIEKLYEIYCEIKRSSEYSINKKLLYSGEGIIEKLIRDVVDEKTERVVVDNQEDYSYFNNFLKYAAELNCRVELHSDSRALFGTFGIEKEILKLRSSKVLLDDGGYIVIDKTEAMYVIDVNSGKNTKGSTIEKTALDTNLKAAQEIGRQVRLRNLSGIILVDFIDMNKEEYKDKVMSTLKASFEGDKSKIVIYPFTQLNLVQIARERRGKPIAEYMEEECHCCKGMGSRLRLWYLQGLIKNEILRISKDYECKNIYIEINNIYKTEIEKDLNKFIEHISGTDKLIYAKFVEEVDYFKVEPLIFPNHIENMQKYKIYG